MLLALPDLGQDDCLGLLSCSVATSAAAAASAALLLLLLRAALYGSVLLWMDEVLHHLQNPKYQRTLVCYGFKVVQELVHPQYVHRDLARCSDLAGSASGDCARSALSFSPYASRGRTSIDGPVREAKEFLEHQRHPSPRKLRLGLSGPSIFSQPTAPCCHVG